MKEIKPIAYYRSPLTSKFGIPRQSGLASHLPGCVEFVPPFNKEEALRGISAFEYLWLIWGFSANTPSREDECGKLTVRPPRLGGNERLGVFATRSPFRPNGLGLSSVRLQRVAEGKLFVEGGDLMDGTPIYDVKPYLPYADSHPNAKGGFTDNTEWKPLEVDIPDCLLHLFTATEQVALKEVLSQDPRPQYHHDARRIYGMPFAGKEVKFSVQDNTVIVVDILPA